MSGNHPLMDKTASPSLSMQTVSGVVYTGSLTPNHVCGYESMQVKRPAWDMGLPLLGLESGVTR